MKIKKVHLDFIKKECLDVLNDNPNAISNYEQGKFPRSEATKDVQLRFNFDVFRAAIKSSWVCDNLYSYLDDTHIKSALNSFMPKLAINGKTL